MTQSGRTNKDTLSEISQNLSGKDLVTFCQVNPEYCTEEFWKVHAEKDYGLEPLGVYPLGTHLNPTYQQYYQDQVDSLWKSVLFILVSPPTEGMIWIHPRMRLEDLFSQLKFNPKFLMMHISTSVRNQTDTRVTQVDLVGPTASADFALKLRSLFYQITMLSY